MYLAVDIGGTKTLLAAFDVHGKIKKQIKFPTPQSYDEFLKELDKNISELAVEDFRAACVAVPGRLDRELGTIIRCGNLAWKNEPIQADVEKIIDAPVVIENDAKLGGLSEAILIIKDFKKTLYITISTGIGTSIIIDGVIDASMSDSGGNSIMLEHGGKLESWESFASGKAIVARYGKIAAEINDPEAWKTIAHDIAIGLIDLIAIMQPEVIIIGGGVGTHFSKYSKFLEQDLQKYKTPLVTIPPVRQAKRPEEAVIYGCYELAKERYGHLARTA